MKKLCLVALLALAACAPASSRDVYGDDVPESAITWECTKGRALCRFFDPETECYCYMGADMLRCFCPAGLVEIAPCTDRVQTRTQTVIVPMKAP